MEVCDDVEYITNNFEQYEISDYLEEINKYIEETDNSQETPNITDIDYNLYIIQWIDEFIKDCNFVFTRIDMNTNLIYINIIKSICLIPVQQIIQIPWTVNLCDNLYIF